MLKLDAMKFKEEMQRKMQEKYAGLTDDEILERRAHWLATSDDILARWWRGEFDEENLRKRRLAMVAREEAGKYDKS
jgi:predicted house-cleaning noncanonical NTP pyrophosphatase (MazG superfamily)